MRKTIRILVANRPRLMRDLIMSIVTEQSDMELVGELSGTEEEDDIPRRIRDVMPDLVVIGLEDPNNQRELWGKVLRQYPGVGVIAVAEHTNRCVCYWAVTRIESREIEEVSEKGFITAVRTLAERAGTQPWYAPS
jgi:chemotaxis response regulator CheB